MANGGFIMSNSVGLLFLGGSRYDSPPAAMACSSRSLQRPPGRDTLLKWANRIQKR